MRGKREEYTKTLYNEADDISAERRNYIIQQKRKIYLLFIPFIIVTFFTTLDVSQSGYRSVWLILFPLGNIEVIFLFYLDIQQQGYLQITERGIIAPYRTAIQVIKKKHVFLDFHDISSISMNLPRSPYYKNEMHPEYLLIIKLKNEIKKDIQYPGKSSMLFEGNRNIIGINNIFYPLFNDNQVQEFNKINIEKYYRLCEIIKRKCQVYNIPFNYFNSDIDFR